MRPLVLSLLVFWLTACGGDPPPVETTEPKVTALEAREAAWQKMPSGREGVPAIEFRVLRRGPGESPENGSVASVRYKAMLAGGQVVDPGPGPFEFEVGNPDGAIEGWSVVVRRMHVGDVWQVRIPAALAYGERGMRNAVPPNTDMLFDMELVEVR